jgi:putative membrane protein
MTRWILLALLLASAVLPPEGVNPALAFVVGELPVVIALWHFIAWAGWRMALSGFAVIYVVAYSYEFVGTHTGLVFGEYFYSPTAIGPLLAKVPILLPLGYFAMAYGALIVTRLLLGNLNRKLSAIGVVVTAFTTSLVMTFLDLASDPIASTLLGKWTWVDGGSYFGVPVHNYIGWVVTTFTFFLIVTALLNRDSNIHRCEAPRPRNFYAQAIVLYASFGLPVVLNPLLGRTGEIYDSMALVAGLVITVPVIAAAVSLTRHPRGT